MDMTHVVGDQVNNLLRGINDPRLFHTQWIIAETVNHGLETLRDRRTGERNASLYLCGAGDRHDSCDHRHLNARLADPVQEAVHRGIVKKHLADVEDASEISVISGRFSYGNLLREIKKIGNNVMRKKAIVYPFWENKQRAILQVCAVIFLIFLVEAVLVVIAVIGKGSLFYVRNRELLAEKWAHTKDMLMDVGRRTKGKLMKRKIDTVILDIGMVLAEFIPREYLKKVGIREEKIQAVMDAVVENDIWNEYDKGMMSEKEVLNQFIERSPKLEREIRRAFKNLNGIVRRYYYTDGFIEKLKSKGYRVLYLSNISEKLYHECEEELGFIKKMDGGILSFEVKMKKPDKDIYELLIKKYSLNPERCVFLDDREVNLRAAGELGFKTILFEDYESAKQSLKL